MYRFDRRTSRGRRPRRLAAGPDCQAGTASSQRTLGPAGPPRVHSQASHPAEQLPDMTDMTVILGTMTIGGQADAAAGAAMLEAFAAALPDAPRLEVDTARMYQMPNKITDPTADDDVSRSTEAILGALVDPLTLGDRLHLATKANPWAEWDESLSAEGVRLQLETSLAALGVNCVDLFYLHAPDNNTPIRETLQAVDGA
jgi:aryl-alcohol dehydrogenase-like predicted oxidoreductase|eukprot:COSAG06_NODE_6468_length_2922_cov_10.080411_4_plen_200_part_00